MSADHLYFAASPIHGTGGFARTDLPAGTRVIEYVGERITKAESNHRCEGQNHFIFYLDEQFDLDGSIETNPARFLNHSCDPNCETELIDGRLWIMAQRDLRAGEEVTFNYGYDLAFYRDHPCHCGSPKCVGYIVADDFQESLREKLRPD